MSMQKIPLLIGLSAAALLIVGAIALFGNAPMQSLPLSAIAIALMLLNIGMSFATLRSVEGGRRTLRIIGLAANILFTLGFIASLLNLLGQHSISAMLYLLFAYLFLSTLIAIIDGSWGQSRGRLALSSRRASARRS